MPVRVVSGAGAGFRLWPRCRLWKRVAPVHQASVVSGGGRAAVEKPEFHRGSTYRARQPEDGPAQQLSLLPAETCTTLPRAEFEYHFNRRYRLPYLIPGLAHAALRTPPMPERLLKHGL